MSEETWVEEFVKEERDLEAREARGTLRDEWIAANLTALRYDFVTEHSDEFAQFCNDSYNDCGRD
jgi:hypothetical protein